jgi:hypothetical protein
MVSELSIAVTDTDVHPTNARYIELAARFKACWTFHRFQEGLQKFFGLHDLGPTPVDFQSLYKRLKGASAALDAAGSASAGAALRDELEAIAEALGEALADLEGRDTQVAPSLVRRFFLKVDSYDERILIEMVRFYQDVQRGRSWSNDRIDKVDFLVSALGRMIAGSDLGGDRRRLDRVLDSLSANISGPPAESGKIRNRLQLIDMVRDGVDAIGSLSELAEKKLIEKYRMLKHSLGEAFFERSVLGRVVETNVAVGKLVARVSRWEEERIFADYERLADLEGAEVEDRELLDAVTRLRADVGTFRRKIETGSIRIAEVVRLRDSLGSIDASLKARSDEGGSEAVVDEAEVEEAEDDEVGTRPAIVPVAPPTARSEPSELGAASDRPLPQASTEAPPLDKAAQILRGRADEAIAPWLDQLLADLAASDRELPAEEAVSAGDLASYRLEPREVIAYRRLAVGSGEVGRERFLLAAAALRHAMDCSAREGGNATPSRNARKRLLDLADRYLREFSHHLEKAGRESPIEAEALLRCRMRFMRVFSGMWLREQAARQARQLQQSSSS